MSRKSFANILGFSLISVILLLMVMGCSKNEQPILPTGAVTDTPTATPTMSQAIPQRRQPSLSEITEKYPDKKLITIAHNDYFTVSREMNEKINEKLVADGEEFVVYFDCIPEEQYASIINQRMQNGKSPDIICAGVTYSGELFGAQRAKQYDWFEPLDEYLASEEGQELWNAFPENMWENCVVDNCYYGVYVLPNFATARGYMVNRDLMEKYGIRVEDIEGKSIAELGSVFEKVKEPGIRMIDFGREHKYITDSANAISKIDSLVGTTRYDHPLIAYYMDIPECPAFNIFTDPKAVEEMKIFAEYKKKGYYQNSKQVFLYDIVYSELSSEDVPYNEEHLAKYPEVKNYVIIKECPQRLFGTGNNLTGICRTSEQKELARRALTKLYADETISTILLYGIEGIDYKRKDGLIDRTSSLAALYFGNPIIAERTCYEPENKKEVYLEVLSGQYLTTVNGKIFDMTAYEDTMEELMKIYYEYAGLFYGEYENVDEVLAEAVAKTEAAGINEVIDDINRQLEAQRRKR